MSRQTKSRSSRSQDSSFDDAHDNEHDGRHDRRTLVLAVIAGMMFSAFSYYVWCSWQWRDGASTPETPVGVAPTPSPQTNPDTPDPIAPTPTPEPAPTLDPQASFQASGTLNIDARVGQRLVPVNGSTRTQVALTANARQSAGVATRAPANLVLVIDRSGSMSGDRITHARAAAKFAANQLRQGDRISVISYSNSARVELPSTIVTPNNQWRIAGAIQNIQVGGGTCISCGLETARMQLTAGQSDDSVNRLMLLSDGEANAGVIDVDALAGMARGMEQRGSTVTTVGVGLGYNETLMGAVAMAGNGNHHFVEDPSTLQATLGDELETLRSLVARRAAVSFKLAPGTRFVRGFDRDFEQLGDRVVVSLGDLAANQEATVLFEVELSPSDREDGLQPVAEVEVEYDDLTTKRREEVRDRLEVARSSDATKVAASIDPNVAVRLEEARLGDALETATLKMKSGDVSGAQATLASAREGLRDRSAALGGGVEFDAQIDVLTETEEEFGAAAADDADGEAAERAAKKATVRRRDLAR